MLRKLLYTSARNPFYTYYFSSNNQFIRISKQVANISQFKEYVRLSESLNEEAAQRATADYQALAKRYDLGIFFIQISY